MFDKVNTLEATRNALAISLSAPANHTCPDLKAIYMLILKAFFITSVLGWLFIARPSALVNTEHTNTSIHNSSQPQAGQMINYA